MDKRKICVVITARPSYSRIKSALTAINAHPELELQLVVAASALLDRLYLNKGNGHFEKSAQPLPATTAFESTSTVSSADIDLDGDLDLFVGVRVIPFLYGMPGNGYILINDGNGNFSDATNTIAPQLQNVGMITDSRLVDLNQDNHIDLVIVGEWMPVMVFIQEDGKLIDRTKEFGLEKGFCDGP